MTKNVLRGDLKNSERTMIYYSGQFPPTDVKTYDMETGGDWITVLEGCAVQTIERGKEIWQTLFKS